MHLCRICVVVFAYVEVLKRFYIGSRASTQVRLLRSEASPRGMLFNRTNPLPLSAQSARLLGRHWRKIDAKHTHGRRTCRASTQPTHRRARRAPRPRHRRRRPISPSPQPPDRRFFGRYTLLYAEWLSRHQKHYAGHGTRRILVPALYLPPHCAHNAADRRDHRAYRRRHLHRGPEPTP